MQSKHLGLFSPLAPSSNISILLTAAEQFLFEPADIVVIWVLFLERHVCHFY